MTAAKTNPANEPPFVIAREFDAPPELMWTSWRSRATQTMMARDALAAGGTAQSQPQDHGFTYGHGYTDRDGHIWELVYLQPEAAAHT